MLQFMAYFSQLLVKILWYSVVVLYDFEINVDDIFVGSLGTIWINGYVC